MVYILIGFRAYTISILNITKGNNSAKIVHGNTVLVLCILFNHGLHLYQVWQKYQAISELASRNALDNIYFKGAYFLEYYTWS